MGTPHIGASAGDFAPCCLLPGDPLRARYVAETFLEDVRGVTTVRNMLGFTGSWQGQAVSVMGTGMGIPSLSIYAHELATRFGVRRLIRVGSCGALDPALELRDVVLGMGACTDSGVNRTRFGGRDFAAIADFGLLQRAAEAATHLGMPVRVGNLFSTDLFYSPAAGDLEVMDRMGVLAVEMEAAGLYGCAAELGVAALTICTVSDRLRGGEQLSASEREASFEPMMRLALEVAVGGPDRSAPPPANPG